MAKNFVQEGKALHLLVEEGMDIKSGDLVAVNDVIGVAITDGVVGELLALHTEGVWNVNIPASVGDVEQGKAVYYDPSAMELSLDSTKKPLGFAWADGAAGDVVPVKLWNSILITLLEQ